MRSVYLFIFFLFIPVLSFSQKQIALTFDDLPMALPRISLQHTVEINQKLLSGLKKQNAPAIGFVNESMVAVDGETNERVDILRMWVKQGFELGNHTYQHVDYDTTPYNTFVEEIKKGEVYTRKVLEENNKKIKFFRPPFLSTGSTIQKKEKLKKLLQDEGYTMALSTIESSDFTFNLIYLKAKFQQDSSEMHKVVQEYLDFTEKKLVYFESVANKVVGTAIPQILLVHVNDINADNIDKLLQLFRAHNYEFISLDEALDNPVYKQKDTYIGKQGISWLHRWNVKDRKALRKKEPRLPLAIKEQNKVAKRYQFFFLFKSRLIGFHYTLFHVSMACVAVLFLIAVIYLILVRRNKRNYLYQ